MSIIRQETQVHNIVIPAVYGNIPVSCIRVATALVSIQKNIPVRYCIGTDITAIAAGYQMICLFSKFYRFNGAVHKILYYNLSVSSLIIFRIPIFDIKIITHNLHIDIIYRPVVCKTNTVFRTGNRINYDISSSRKINGKLLSCRCSTSIC